MTVTSVCCTHRYVVSTFLQDVGKSDDPFFLFFYFFEELAQEKLLCFAVSVSVLYTKLFKLF